MKKFTKVVVAVTVMGILLCACQKKSPSSSVTETGAESENTTVQSDLDAMLNSSDDREMLSYGETADHVAVNCLIDNPYIGDERNFVSIIDVGTEEENPIDLSTGVSGEFTFEPGHQYAVLVYTNNSADPELGEAVYAWDIGSTISFPETLSAGSTDAQLSCLVSYENDDEEVEFVGYTMPIQATADLSFQPSEVGMGMSYDCQVQNQRPLLVATSDNVVAMSCVLGGSLWPGLENSGYMVYYVETVAE